MLPIPQCFSTDPNRTVIEVTAALFYGSSRHRNQNSESNSLALTESAASKALDLLKYAVIKYLQCDCQVQTTQTRDRITSTITIIPPRS